jgi:protease I
MLDGLSFAVLLEEGTNPIEYQYIRLRLKEAGAQVTVIGLNRLDYKLEDQSLGYADITADQITGRSFDGVMIPGGLGPEKLRQDKRIIALVQDCYRRSKVCAAICHGQFVLISAGLMRGVRATSAWSMMDDLRMVGAVVPENVRAVRDGQIITAIFPQDLPEFFGLFFEAITELEGRQLPDGYSRKLSGQTWGIVLDNASDSVQVQYLRLCIQEDGGRSILLGRSAGQQIMLSSPAWEWGEMGWSIGTEKGLPHPSAISSCDTEAELSNQAVTAEELDGLLLPGGLATWMIRAHPGLRQLIKDIDSSGKPIGAIERGPKLLFMTGVLDGKTVTCAPQMRDDIVYAIAPVEYSDQAVVHDGNLITCRGTEDLPEFMRTLISQYGSL